MALYYEPREQCIHIVGVGDDRSYIGYGYDSDDGEAMAIIWKPNADYPVMLKDREVRFALDSMMDALRINWEHMISSDTHHLLED